MISIVRQRTSLRDITEKPCFGRQNGGTMDVSQFQEKLSGICALAQENGGKLTAAQVRTFFAQMDLSKTQLLKVLQYLKVQGIVIEGVDTGEVERRREEHETAIVPLTPEEEAYWEEYKTALERNGEEGRSTKVLFAALANGDAKAREILAQRYLPEAAELARQMNCEEIFLADLIQEANVSLLMALGSAGSERRDHEWLMGEIRAGIRRAVEEQTQRKIADDCLVAKVQNLEAALKELTEDEEEGESKFSIGELAVILDMDVEEIQDVLRLTGDDK
ncbi:MAG: hypothetical protein Q4D16_03550 [Eubacteriales bacterium]|nr:hypothetical protein [Eubacteriales bacterium]